MPYTIGVSSGWWAIAREPGLLGLGLKTMTGATYGVEFIQADIENPAEMIEPDLNKQMMWARENLGMRWGIHGEIGILIAWDAALEEFWRQSHRKLHKYLDNIYDIFIKKQPDGKTYEKYKPEYVNFHASNMQPLEFIIERYRMYMYAGVDFKGRRDWRELMSEVPELKDWFTKNLLPFIVPDSVVLEALGPEARRLSPEELNSKRYEVWEKIGKGVIRNEEYVYTIVAKYLEIKRNDPNEPIWNLFFPKETFDDVITIIKEKEQVTLTPPVIAAVAARYVIGHFQTEPLKEDIKEKERLSKGPIDEFYKLNALQKLEKLKVIICFEPPELMEGFEGLNRILHAKHIYNMVKAMNSPFVKMLIDFEHLLHNGLNPEDEIPELPEDLGNYLIGCHVGTPKPVHPAHVPIEVGSEGQRILYKWLLMLRKKGFKNGYLIFERGGRPGAPPGEFIGASVTAIRLIVEQLEKEVPLEKLPLEFFGLATGEAASLERQRVIMIEHAYDPLKGLIVAPEEEYTALGRAAMEKPGVTPEKWKKEELR